MDTLELHLPSDTYRALREVAASRNKPEAEFALEALQRFLDQSGRADDLVAVLGDEAALLDQVTDSAMADREALPWRWCGPDGAGSAPRH